MTQEIFIGAVIGVLIELMIIMAFGKIIIGPWECFEYKNKQCINWYKVDEQ
jgi:hypothetical protein